MSTRLNFSIQVSGGRLSIRDWFPVAKRLAKAIKRGSRQREVSVCAGNSTLEIHADGSVVETGTSDIALKQPGNPSTIS